MINSDTQFGGVPGRREAAGGGSTQCAGEGENYGASGRAANRVCRGEEGADLNGGGRLRWKVVCIDVSTPGPLISDC